MALVEEAERLGFVLEANAEGAGLPAGEADLGPAALAETFDTDFTALGGKLGDGDAAAEFGFIGEAAGDGVKAGGAVAPEHVDLVEGGSARFAAPLLSGVGGGLHDRACLYFVWSLGRRQ